VKDAEVKSEGRDRREGKAHFKKKGGNRNKGKKEQSTADDAFRGVGFSIHREGPELYLRTIERLGLYVSTQFKNGSNVKMCLKQEKMIRTPYPDLADEHTTHEKRIWEFKMTKILKTERVLEGNLWNLFAVLMSLCDSETKHQVESSPEFNELEETLDSMGLLALIKKLVYTGGANNKNLWHNKAMAIMKMMTLYQEKFQDIQEFRDQYLAIWKVCNELNIRFGQCKDDAKAMLVKEGITELTTAQLKSAMDKVEEELHAIIFMYKTDRSRYGRIIE